MRSGRTRCNLRRRTWAAVVASSEVAIVAWRSVNGPVQASNPSTTNRASTDVRPRIRHHDTFRRGRREGRGTTVALGKYWNYDSLPPTPNAANEKTALRQRSEARAGQG